VVRLTSQNFSRRWPIFHPLGECEWRAVVMVMPAGDKSWLVYQSLLVVLPAERHPKRVGGIDKGMRILHIQYLWYVSRSFTCCKILQHGTSGFTSYPKEGVLWIFIALKNLSPRLGLNPRPLGPVAGTLTTTPLRWPLLLTDSDSRQPTSALITHNKKTMLWCRHQIFALHYIAWWIA
jgi:hypothetical protein